MHHEDLNSCLHHQASIAIISVKEGTTVPIKFPSYYLRCTMLFNIGHLKL